MKTPPISHVRISLAWIGAALAVVCLAGPARAGATTFPPMSPAPGQTVVSIEFDDATSDQIAARPLLAAHNMKATFFINSGTLINSFHMTWGQVHELYADGNEIAGHTLDHPHLTQLSTEEAKREICNDRVNLLNQGFQPTDFAYPFGDYNSTDRSLAQECGYDSARWILGVRSPACEEELTCPFAESIPPADPYVTRTPRNILATDSLANIESYVTQAQQSGGGWVQLVFHHICNECDTYAVTEPNFSALLGWLATQQNTTTATVQQVIGGPLQPAVSGPAPINLPGPNLLPNPSLEEESPFTHGVPTGWDTTSYGANTATWTRTADAHSGNYAERVELTNFTSGAARLLTHMDQGQYAPTPTVGDSYDIGEYYKSNAPVLFYIYTRDQMGEWNWWTNSGFLPASSSWTKATFTTPPIPAGTTGISVGLGIQQAGTLTVDDPSLLDRGVIPPPTNVLPNPGLETLSSGAPLCWSPVIGGGSTLTGTWSNTTEAHGGSNAELASVSSYTSGDMKLISQQDATLANPTLTSAAASATGGSLAAATYYYEITATTAYGETLPSNQASATTTGSSGSVVLKWPALTSASVTGYRIYRASASGQETLLTSVASTATGYTDTGSVTPGTSTPPASNTASKVKPCAPTAAPGDTYQGSAWYRSSASASVRLIVYYRDATGNWVFWKTQPVPASTTWTQASVITEALPPGATALSFGVSLYSAGTLYADDLSLGDATVANASDPPPCGSDACDTTAPASSASSPAYSTSQTLSVSYSAADNSGGSGLARVDLYVKGPADLGYTLAASNPGYTTSGVFSYAALEGDGPYSFYTVATDIAGNSETAPLSPESTTVVDTTPPTSVASAPAVSNSKALTVGYTAADATSGVARVDLYAQAAGQSTYSLVASDTSGSGSGSFSYTAAAGDGTYSFYTVATDRAGNVQVAPASANATTLIDTAAPSSKASAPALSSSTSLTVSYTAADNPGGSGLAEVDLYAQAAGQSTYSLVASDTSGSGSGSFSYTAAAGDGTYSFYTVATDRAGNVQVAPASANATTLIDTAAPSSKASAPISGTYGPISVSYTATDNEGGSGLARVDLYVQAPGQSSYTKAASDTSGSGSGSFSYTPGEGNGSYNFYTIATDKAGNAQVAPSGPDASTTYTLDTTPPVSHANAPAFDYASSFTVSYTASDNEGGSGLARVDLYVEGPGQSSYTKVASDTSGSGSGSFSYTPSAGNGTYSFYTLATDNAGNVQAAPASPDASTSVIADAIAPASKASAPASATYGAIPVGYTASDNEGGSGLARVDLYVEGPGQSSYTKVASDTSGSGSGSFSYTPSAGNGTYSFYTLATDKAGNVQPAPATPDAATSYTLDTIAPTATASALAYSNTATWTVSYTASDNTGGSGLAAVELWVRSPGAGSYAKAATNTGSGTSGSFAYTAVAGDGSYAFYTIAVDQAGNRQASPSVPNTTTTLDTVAPSAFQMTNPGQYLSGNVKLSLSSAPTDGGSGVASVSYQYRAGGTSGAWATACTVAASPWSCNWNTATKATPDGSYELRAVATDRAGNVTVASNAPLTITIENATPTAKNVSTANVSGGVVGKAQTGDSMTFTYSTTMNPGSILAGWSGAATAVQVKLVAKTTKDTTLAVWSSAGAVQLALANPLDLGASYVTAGGATFNATMAQKGAAITVTLGALASGSVQATPVTGGTLSWTPSNGATDLAGNKCSTTSVSAAGPAF